MATVQKTSRNQDRDRIEAEVLVIGGGMAGMTLGNALAGAGVTTVVIDSSPPEDLLDVGYDGRASAIAWGSAQVFKGIGLWPYLESEAGPIVDIRVADGTVERGPSMLFLHYDHEDIGDDPFGYMIENRATRRGLFAQAKDLDALKLLSPARVATLDRSAGGVDAELEDGTTFARAWWWAPKAGYRQPVNPPAFRYRIWHTTRPPLSAPSPMNVSITAWRSNISCPRAPLRCCR